MRRSYAAGNERGGETKELHINIITNRISDYGHKACENNENMKDILYFKGIMNSVSHKKTM